MTETPTERAARALYVHECGTRDVQIEQAHKYWDDHRSRKWVDIKIASMATAIAEYEAAKAQESAAKRERAIEAACVAFGRHVHEHGGMVGDGDELQAMGMAITAYERVMAEPDAAQPRKEGA